MANDEMPAEGKPFDVATIRELAVMMAEHDLSEVMLDTAAGQIRLRRGPRGVLPVFPAPAPAHPPAAALSAPASASKTSNLIDIKSEAIGTFYSRANPDTEPYVKVGAKVTPVTVVGLIEAMKMFNEITAGCSGTIAEILVQNQDPVEYGSVLFRVDPG